MSLGSGETAFSNLTVRPSVLSELSLPLSLRDGALCLVDPFLFSVSEWLIPLVFFLLLGFLRKLKLKIPWRNLGAEPAIVNIEGLYLIVTPKPKSDVRCLLVIFIHRQAPTLCCFSLVV